MPLLKKNKNKQGYERAKCEFCNLKHGVSEEMCDLKIDEVDGNTMEGASKITLQQILDKMENPRPLVLAVVLKGVHQPNFTHFKSQYVEFKEDDEEAEEKEDSLNLGSCFSNYSEEETLTGDDRWYCRTCKEHRDINKKLEIYKAPKVMIL